LDAQGYVQYKGDEKYPTLASIFNVRNEDTSDALDTSDMYGLTGGSQAIAGYLFSPNWVYGINSLFDMLVESFAGTHDFIGGQITGFYDAEGNTARGRSDFTKTVSNTWAVGAIPVAASFALSDLVSPELLQILFAVGG
jgi:filamentous hemagglutinin